MKKIISTFLCVAMLATFIPFFASAEGDGRNVVDSGTCAKDVTWVLYDDGELVISGTGVVPSFSFKEGYKHWYSHINRIKIITVQEGITGISGYAFNTYEEDCYPLLYKIRIPNSVKSIGSHIVREEEYDPIRGIKMKAVCFAGSEERWNSFFEVFNGVVYDDIYNCWELYFNGEEPKPYCKIEYYAVRYSGGSNIETGPFIVGARYYAEGMDVSFEWNVTGTTEILQENKDENGIITGLELKPFKRGNAYVSLKMLDNDGNVIDSAAEKYTTWRIAAGDDLKTVFSKIKAQIIALCNLSILGFVFGTIASSLGILYVIEIIKLKINSWFK